MLYPKPCYNEPCNKEVLVYMQNVISSINTLSALAFLFYVTLVFYVKLVVLRMVMYSKFTDVSRTRN